MRRKIIPFNFLKRKKGGKTLYRRPSLHGRGKRRLVAFSRKKSKKGEEAG